MIITRILPHAGMGNQMFMYAAGLSLSQKLGTELRLGAWDFETNTSGDEVRPYHLSLFPEITERNASLRELLMICPMQIFLNTVNRKPVKKRHIFRRTILKTLNVLRMTADLEVGRQSRLAKVHVQEAMPYSPDFWNIPDGTMIVGYWESEKYFAPYADMVRRKFTFPDECYDPALSAKIRACNSAAIHVRRGDKTYLEGVSPSDGRYIRNAIGRLSSLTENPSFFVFSDDLDWCRKNLPMIHEADYTFVEGQTPPQDMALMTLCRHVIMGPSTFSWWGAWLTESPGKIIIAPDVNLWVKSGAEERRDLLPDRWIKIG